MLEKLLSWELPPTGQSFLNVVLIWIGFALLIGLTARTLIPGKRGRSAWMTFIIGLTGACLGPLLVTTFFPIDLETFNPIGLFGFLVSVISAAVALILFHLTMLIFPPKPPKEKE